jgi:CheY-like chemotaxis protein
MTHHDILIVEDNADASETLRMLLELEGHRVAVADAGERGVALARTRPFSIGLIDIGLPDVDGYEVARRIRALPGRGKLFLVALTGYGQPDDRLRAQEAGFDAHIVKPVDPDDLFKLLNRPAL